MAERVDRIILLFDAHKLDISDEFRRTIHAMKGYDEKIRIVLNKADMVDHQQLMRVYGALMWSLGKVFNTPEVCVNNSDTHCCHIGAAIKYPVPALSVRVSGCQKLQTTADPVWHRMLYSCAHPIWQQWASVG